jgi:hypothetical protein
MTPTAEPAFTLLRPGTQVRLPSKNDPSQPWLTPAPVTRTIRAIVGRQVTFTDGASLTLPPAAQIRLGKTTGGLNTLVLTYPPQVILILTIMAQPAPGPALNWASFCARCLVGAWLEVERDDWNPKMYKKPRWTAGIFTVNEKLDPKNIAIKFADNSLLPIQHPDKLAPEFSADGTRVTWHKYERKNWLAVPDDLYRHLRFRDDLRPPR